MISRKIGWVGEACYVTPVPHVKNRFSARIEKIHIKYFSYIKKALHKAMCDNVLPFSAGDLYGSPGDTSNGHTDGGVACSEPPTRLRRAREPAEGRHATLLFERPEGCVFVALKRLAAGRAAKLILSRWRG